MRGPEQLGAVRDQLGARDAGGQGHLLGQADAAVEAAAGEALADRCHVEQVQLLEHRLRRVRDVLEVIAAEQDGDVVLLEHRPLRIAAEPPRR